MATNTTNYGMVKPAKEEFYDVGVQNSNMDKVDTALFEHTTDTTSHVTQEQRTEWNGKADESHGHEFTEISGTPSTYPPANHNHPWSDVTGQPTVFPPSGHTHQWGDVTGEPATYPPSTHSHPWSAVTSKPTTFPPSAHNQAWNTVTGKPTTFTPSTHTHQATQVPISAATATAIFGAGNKNVDQALAKLKADDVKILYGSYVGTGTFGSSSPNSLTFPFAPKIVWIYMSMDEEEVIKTTLMGATSNSTYPIHVPSIPLQYASHVNYSNSSGLCESAVQKRSVDGKTVYWYTGPGADAYEQNNRLGVIYYYVAIG